MRIAIGLPATCVINAAGSTRTFEVLVRLMSGTASYQQFEVLRSVMPP